MGKKSNINESRRVGRQLSFALYSASNRIIRLHRPFLEPLGLTYPQFLVMLALYDNTPRTVGELGVELPLVPIQGKRWKGMFLSGPSGALESHEGSMKQN